jgi:hypothetical protein
MMYYYLNPKSHVMLLQILLMVLLIIIISMIYYQSTLTDQLNEDILALDIDCPDVNCPENKDCPDCVCSDNKTPCPDCPDCPDVNANCPTVDDIVSGIFPGRTTGLTSGGRYFEINTNESYELLPDYDYYNPQDAFPTDSILDEPLISGNPPVSMDEINNSIDNLNIDTSVASSLSGMNMGTGASPRSDSLSTVESKEPTPEERTARNEAQNRRNELQQGI